METSILIKQKGDNYCNADTYPIVRDTVHGVGRCFGMGELSKSSMHKHAATGGGGGGDGTPLEKLDCF